MQHLRRHNSALQRTLTNIPNTKYGIELGLVRHASLTSAINRGIRRGSNTYDRIGSRPKAIRETQPENNGRHQALAPRTRFEIERHERSSTHPPRRKRWGSNGDGPRPFQISREAPVGVPYTTAGSEFVYGTFAVKAALEAKRRQLYKIYVWRGGDVDGQHENNDELASMSKLARSRRVRVQDVTGPSWEKLLLKMSGQRPHNGYVLEASPIPKLPVFSLERMDNADGALNVAVSPHSAEDELVNKTFKAEGSSASILRPRSGQHRYPLLLWLDRITDTGNVGAIIRTAYFFGIDAVVIPEHGTAPFSPITVKASAGTAEYMPVLTVRKELDFVQQSKQNGWKFFAAVAPESGSTRRQPQTGTSTNATAAVLDSNPCVLMIGNEGEGLRSFLQRAADEPISIEGARGTSSVVDSLNVSVAAALLVSKFIQPAEKARLIAAPVSAEQTPLAEDQKSEAMF